MTRAAQHTGTAVQGNFRGSKHRVSGFTLLELLVVVGILAALVALALPYYQDYLAQSKITAAQSELQMFAKALQLYDQQESLVFGQGVAAPDFLPLIGKYIQDYRKTAAQLMPLDPWGNPYLVYKLTGVIQSNGPNGANDNAGARIPAGTIDDIVVTWKPGYYVSSIKAVNLTTVDVTFSRKAGIPAVGGLSLAPGPLVSTVVMKVNDYKYRFTVPTMAAGTTYTGTVTFVAALDGAAAFDANPYDDGSGTGGGVRQFVP